MLREIHSARQNHPHRTIRRFSNANMELYVWFKTRNPVGFQLCFDKTQREDCINWHIKRGFSRLQMNAEAEHIKYRLSAYTSSQSDFDVTAIASEFLRASEQLDVALADFIFARLLEFPYPS